MLRHPHIIQYYDSFLHESAMMIVMEYAAGGTLHDLIQAKKAAKAERQEGHPSPEEGDEEEEIAFLFAQIILPMHYIHSQHILHRDLKAQNIFLTKNKNLAKVCKTWVVGRQSGKWQIVGLALARNSKSNGGVFKNSLQFLL